MIFLILISFNKNNYLSSSTVESLLMKVTKRLQKEILGFYMIQENLVVTRGASDKGVEATHNSDVGIQLKGQGKHYSVDPN